MRLNDLNWMRQALVPKDGAVAIVIDRSTAAWKLRDLIHAMPFTAEMAEEWMARDHTHAIFAAERTGAGYLVRPFMIAEATPELSAAAFIEAREATKHVWLFLCGPDTTRRLLDTLQREADCATGVEASLVAQAS